MNKGLKTFALVGLAACAIGAASALTACDNREKFTIWAAEEMTGLVEQEVNEYIGQFKGTDDEFPYKLTVSAVSESNAVTNVLTDVSASADIFFFAQDQLARVVQSGALSQVPELYLNDVVSRNDDISLKAGSVGDVLYVYPVTSDNGYFAYYDTSVLTPADMKTQEAIIAKLTETGNKVSFNLTSGWYNAAYFFGAGCRSEWTTDENGTFIEADDNYYSLAGYDALLGMAQLINSGVWVDANSAQGFASNSAIVVSGTWDSNTAKQLLGSNYGVTELWTVTVPDAYVPDEGETSHTYHLGSFSGCKLLGVRRSNDGEKVAWAHSIANYLTEEKCELERYYANGWGPSNLEAQKNEDVAADEALNALAAQNEYATMQGNYPGSWWDSTETIGNQVQQANSTVIDEETLESILSAYQAWLEQTIALASSDAWYAVTGNLEGSSWDVMPALDGPYAFTESNANAGTFNLTAGVAHGVWETDITLLGGGCYVNGNEVGSGPVYDDDGNLTSEAVGTELGLFRVTNYNDWSGNWGYNELTNKTGYYDWNGAYGGGTDNNIGALPGNYHLVFDFSGSTPAITVTAAA